MRYKVRQLIKMLRGAGYACDAQKGKGSHRRFYHPKGKTITICHHDNDDAPPYLAKQVFAAIEAVKGAGE